MRLAIIVAMLLFSSQLLATTHECTTRIGINGFYDLVLDTEASTVKVTTANGSIFRGTANFSHSVRQNRDYYFLPLGYGNMAIEVRVHSNSDIWLCLDEQTCGICR